MSVEVLAIIPARGGSKGIPRKNIRKLAGRPLLAYTAEAALQSRLLNKIILSTEDDEIAQIGKDLGLEVPFMRPMKLAQDDTPSLLVFQHVLRELEKREAYIPDLVVILQPTSPFRTSRNIDEALFLLIESKADAVVSVVEVPHNMNPFSIMKLKVDGTLHPFLPYNEKKNIRQLKPKFYARNGAAIYACTRKCLLENDSLYGDKTMAYHMAEISSIDIDTLYDWTVAEVLLESGKYNMDLI